MQTTFPPKVKLLVSLRPKHCVKSLPNSIFDLGPRISDLRGRVKILAVFWLLLEFHFSERAKKIAFFRFDTIF